MATAKNKLITVLPSQIERGLEDKRVDQQASMNPELAAMPERRRRLVMILLRDPTMPFRDAAEQVGYSIKSKSAVATIKRSIQGALSETFRQAGLYELDIARVIIRALDACHHKAVSRETYDGSGKLKEKKTEMVLTPDYKTQLAAVSLLAKLGGYLAPKKLEVSGKIIHERTKGDIDPGVLEDRIRQLEKQGVKAEFEVLEEDDY